MKKARDPMHISEKHPFQKNGKTPKPALGRSGAAHPSPGGSVGKFRSANAQMKGK